MSDQPDRPKPGPIIEFINVSYRLPNGQTLLNETSLAVPRGETLVLLGRSGAGKTTALKLINRLLEPSTGELRVEGRETRAWDAIALRRRIGYVIQEGGLFPHYTIEENIALVHAKLIDGTDAPAKNDQTIVRNGTLAKWWLRR